MIFCPSATGPSPCLRRRRQELRRPLPCVAPLARSTSSRRLAVTHFARGVRGAWIGRRRAGGDGAVGDSSRAPSAPRSRRKGRVRVDRAGGRIGEGAKRVEPGLAGAHQQHLRRQGGGDFVARGGSPSDRLGGLAPALRRRVSSPCQRRGVVVRVRSWDREGDFGVVLHGGPGSRGGIRLFGPAS